MLETQIYRQQEFIAGIWFATRLLLERVDAVQGDAPAKKYAEFIINTSGINRIDLECLRENIGFENEEFLKLPGLRQESQKEE